MMNGFMTPRGECSIDKGVATSSFVFRPTEGGTSMRLEFDGDALLSPTLQAQLAQSEPSFRVAIQRADALVRP